MPKCCSAIEDLYVCKQTLHSNDYTYRFLLFEHTPCKTIKQIHQGGLMQRKQNDTKGSWAYFTIFKLTKGIPVTV